MKIIKQGAEAKLYLDKDMVIKDRIRKGYRIKQIDEKIRRFRTSLEAKLISEARRAGVPTPMVLDADKNEYKITMEFIDGKRIKEYFDGCKESEVKRLSEQIGRQIGILHSSGIIHGDLTTSNMILKEEKIYFIDFGLGFFSRRIEDQATDLKLMKEAIQSTHFKILKQCWDNILKGYKKEYKDADKVIERVKEIEKRVRYAQKQE
ncbi:MAG: KEOPS complex kinase/ATPase Bud32 [Fervidobacterium sp.]